VHAADMGADFVREIVESLVASGKMLISVLT
jgi:hypothetical protein